MIGCFCHIIRENDMIIHIRISRRKVFQHFLYHSIERAVRSDKNGYILIFLYQTYNLSL